MFNNCSLYFEKTEVDILNQYEEFVKEYISPFTKKMEDTEQIDKDYWYRLGEHRYLGPIIDKKYGGLGGSVALFAEMTRILSKQSGSFGLAYDIHAGLASYMISKYGSEKQKEAILPEMASGKKVVSFAMSEEQAGSDISGIKTEAYNDGNLYHIYGKKIFTSNAINADLFLTVAKVKGTENSMTLFIIENDPKTVKIVERMNMIGLKALFVGTEEFKDVVLKNGSIIGNIGDGTKIALSALDIARIGVAAQAVGIGEAAFEYAYKYAKERRQFNNTISEIRTISDYFAEMYTNLHTARITYLDAAKKIETNEKTISASVAKIYCTEKCKKVVDTAMQIVGGRSYLLNNSLQRYMRDIKITEIYEGTNEIQKYIIFNQLKKLLG